MASSWEEGVLNREQPGLRPRGLADVLEEASPEQSKLGEFLRVQGKEGHQSTGRWERAVCTSIAVRA